MELGYAKKALRAFGQSLLPGMKNRAVADAIAGETRHANHDDDKIGVLVACYDPRLTESISAYTGDRYYVPRAAGGVLVEHAPGKGSQQRRSVLLPINLKGELTDTIIIMGHTHCLACAETCRSAILKSNDDHTSWIPEPVRNLLFGSMEKRFQGQDMGTQRRLMPIDKHLQYTAEEFGVLQSMRNVMEYTTEDGKRVGDLVAEGKLHVIGAMMDLRDANKKPYPVRIFDPDRRMFVPVQDVVNAIDGTEVKNEWSRPLIMQKGSVSETVHETLTAKLTAATEARLAALSGVVMRTE